MVKDEYTKERRTVVVIGGTGHVGSYLVPLLVDLPEKPDVVVISRGLAQPYPAAYRGPAGAIDPRWEQVRRVQLDREADGARFAKQIAALSPDVVIDMICFGVRSCKELVEALCASPPPQAAPQLIHCGSIWAYGPTSCPPTTEDGAHAEPLAEYGRGKRDIEAYLLRELHPAGRLTRTVLHPGHICGRGWAPLNPQGNFDPRVFGALRRGEVVALPNLGMECVHHVHAEDVAHAFLAAMASPAAADGQAFSVCSPAALTLRSYAERAAREVWPPGEAAAPAEYSAEAAGEPGAEAPPTRAARLEFIPVASGYMDDFEKWTDGACLSVHMYM